MCKRALVLETVSSVLLLRWKRWLWFIFMGDSASSLRTPIAEREPSRNGQLADSWTGMRVR